MIRLAVSVFWLGGCAALLPPAECTLHGGSEWLRLSSDHFVLTTDADAAVAHETIVRLERIRGGLLRFWGTELDPPAAVDVILLRNQREWVEFVDRSVGGFMLQGARRPLIVLVGRLSLADRGAAFEAVAHESRTSSPRMSSCGLRSGSTRGSRATCRPSSRARTARRWSWGVLAPTL